MTGCSGWSGRADVAERREKNNLRISLDRESGRIDHCSIPADRFHGPLVPRVTLTQAKRIAGPHACHDPAVVPFETCYPQLGEDTLGVLGVSWQLHQVYSGADADGEPEVSTVSVEAMSGQEAHGNGRIPRDGFVAAWRVPLWEQAQATQQLLAPPPVPTVSIGYPTMGLWAFEPPTLRDREVWVRIELLRDQRVRVFGLPRNPTLRFGKYRFAAQECGARLQEHGWWVPFGRVARKFNWQVKWNGPARTLEVKTPPPLLFSQGGSGNPIGP